MVSRLSVLDFIWYILGYYVSVLFVLEQTLNKCNVCKNSESRGQKGFLVRVIEDVEEKERTVEVV